METSTNLNKQKNNNQGAFQDNVQHHFHKAAVNLLFNKQKEYSRI